MCIRDRRESLPAYPRFLSNLDELRFSEHPGLIGARARGLELGCARKDPLDRGSVQRSFCGEVLSHDLKNTRTPVPRAGYCADTGTRYRSSGWKDSDSAEYYV